jgi:hypothetical protein
MNGWKRPHLNLASQPLRNRRFYLASLAALAVLFILVAGLVGLWLVRSSGKASSAAEAVVAADARLYAAEGERNDLVRRTEALQGKDRELVAQVNAAIARKSFSYVEFFALLEEALPRGSYISALGPIAAGEGRIEARLRVVTAGFEDLMGLMTKLEALKFKNLTIRGENQMGSQIIAEIGLAYERPR